MTGDRPEPAPLRVDLDSEQVGRGLTQLVVTVLEVVRELLERQAVRRMEAGDLSDAQVERVGRALRDMRVQLRELFDAVTAPADGTAPPARDGVSGVPTSPPPPTPRKDAG